MHCSTRADPSEPPVDKSGWMWNQDTPKFADSLPPDFSLPRITIVTPSYNQGRFLETTIRSVLLQGYPNLEYIIIDGGSSDNSVEIIQKYEPWLAYWISEKDRGQAHALNKGFARASGDIYTYLNSDDFYELGALQSCALGFEGGHQWVVGRVRCWQEGVGDWPFPELPEKSFTKWFLSCPIPQPGSFWTAEIHREMGPFREDLNYIIDYEFWLRLRFIKKITPFVIDQPIAVYRLHPKSKTVARTSEFTREGNPIREQYKGHLSLLQRMWLWVARRHRQARVRGSRAISLFNEGEFRAATRLLMSALMVWPLLVIDFKAIPLALSALTNPGQDRPAMPEVWPEWDE